LQTRLSHFNNRSRITETQNKAHHKDKKITKEEHVILQYKRGTRYFADSVTTMGDFRARV